MLSYYSTLQLGPQWSGTVNRITVFSFFMSCTFQTHSQKKVNRDWSLNLRYTHIIGNIVHMHLPWRLTNQMRAVIANSYGTCELCAVCSLTWLASYSAVLIFFYLLETPIPGPADYLSLPRSVLHNIVHL